ncbi:MAG: hypothetical protein EZS28_009439 [Streblomastix strix]|uniref:Uncharacterized protein n=1 Tax=Streblomastix strix TaxID=222440 RepID=A0A5J4WJ65_9EUKA|nr:MAG: hypothetical protein EZS28_009439 [Streblomastix strix]
MLQTWVPLDILFPPLTSPSLLEAVNCTPQAGIIEKSDQLTPAQFTASLIARSHNNPLLIVPTVMALVQDMLSPAKISPVFLRHIGEGVGVKPAAAHYMGKELKQKAQILLQQIESQPSQRSDTFETRDEQSRIRSQNTEQTPPDILSDRRTDEISRQENSDEEQISDEEMEGSQMAQLTQMSVDSFLFDDLDNI